jgi:glutamyl-tRNA reductase
VTRVTDRTGGPFGYACVGLSQKTAPLALRERLAVAADLAAVRAAGLPAAAGASELAVLQTCNRTELYAWGGPGTAAGLQAFVGEAAGLDGPALLGHAYVLEGPDVARHLMAVAAGLDSLILGEAQILGQVRQALAQAAEAGLAGTALRTLFTAALRAGRRARHETDIGRGAASVPSAAVALACRGLSPAEVARRAVVVVGAGKMGLLAARALLDHGVQGVVVSNRSPERAQALAEAWGGRAVPFGELGATLAGADIVISSTGAPRPIIDRPLVEAAMAGRADRPLLLVDIALPRDVAPEVAEVPGVTLHGLDDLAAVVADNLAERSAAVPAVEALLAREAERFTADLVADEAQATVAALVRWAEGIRASELERHLRRLGGLGSRDQEVVRALSVALVGKLLHPAITHLKGAPELDPAWVARLFDLPLDGAGSPGALDDAAPLDASAALAGDVLAGELPQPVVPVGEDEGRG